MTGTVVGMRCLAAVLVATLPAPQTARIVVNIPAYRVELHVQDSVVLTAPVAVGTRRFRTPQGQFTVTSVEWNPWWIPPDSRWARKEKVTPPGPRNPMGRVKINFRPMYFLHGTPLPQSIGTAGSHGCIRLHNADAIELARLVHRFGTPGMPASVIDQLTRDTVTTRQFDLDEPVPIEIRYDLVEVRDSRIFAYPDIYRLATRPLVAEILAALSEAGVDTVRVDPLKVRAFAKGLPAGGRAAPVESLFDHRPE